MQWSFFLRLLQYLLQFSTCKNLTYTKFLQMFWRICKTKPFIDSYSTSRDRQSKASPFFWKPLTFHPYSFSHLSRQWGHFSGNKAPNCRSPECVKKIQNAFTKIDRISYLGLTNIIRHYVWQVSTRLCTSFGDSFLSPLDIWNPWQNHCC